MKGTEISQAGVANLVTNSDNTTDVVESISIMHNHGYPYHNASLRFYTVILFKSKTTDTKHTYIFKFVK